MSAGPWGKPDFIALSYQFVVNGHRLRPQRCGHVGAFHCEDWNGCFEWRGINLRALQAYISSGAWRASSVVSVPAWGQARVHRRAPSAETRYDEANVMVAENFLGVHHDTRREPRDRL